MRAMQTGDDVSIPVVVDDVKSTRDFPMTRCTYFSVECEHPSPDWVLAMPELGLPFLMLGLSGIVTQPSEDHPLFDTPERFEDFYSNVEQHKDLFVDSNDIWLPNSLFRAGSAKRGDVFRIGLGLFERACGYRYDAVDFDQFTRIVRELDEPPRPSPEETRALHDWTWHHIDLIKADHEGNPTRKLDRIRKGD